MPLSIKPAVVAALAAAALSAQGPGSCGFHLDLLTVDTCTHAAVADMPGAVGDTIGIAPGAPGNPYTAWTPVAAPMTLVLTIPAGTLGPAPVGAGSPVTIIWSVGAVPLGLPLGPPFIPTCSGGAHILDIFPVGGTIVDGIGIFSPPPIIPTADPGYPTRFTATLFYPPVPLPVISFQAVVLTATGAVAVSNAVAVLTGPNPGELSVVAGLVPSGVFAPTDEGQALGIAAPPLFSFYGTPTAAFDVDVNGFLDFCPGAGTCGGPDFFSLSDGAGCVPTSPVVRPRVNVSHFDVDLAVPPPAPRVADITVEAGPPGPFWVARTIVRWKHVMPFGSVPGLPISSYFVAEVLDDSRIAVVRQGLSNGPVGIGPGDVGQGYGGPSPGVGDTCALAGGIQFSTLWGFPPFVGAGAGVIEQDAGVFNITLSNLAVVFTPAPAVPIGPFAPAVGAYSAATY